MKTVQDERQGLTLDKLPWGNSSFVSALHGYGRKQQINTQDCSQGAAAALGGLRQSPGLGREDKGVPLSPPRQRNPGPPGSHSQCPPGWAEQGCPQERGFAPERREEAIPRCEGGQGLARGAPSSPGTPGRAGAARGSGRCRCQGTGCAFTSLPTQTAL